MTEPSESPHPQPSDLPTEAGQMIRGDLDATDSTSTAEKHPPKRSKRSLSARVRAFVLLAEAFHDLAILLLRFFELAVFGGVLLALAAGLCRWVRTGPTLPEVMSVIATHWQGAVIIGLILVMPTIRELVERVQKLPGGWQIRTREEKHVQRRQVEDEDGSESEEEA